LKDHHTRDAGVDHDEDAIFDWMRKPHKRVWVDHQAALAVMEDPTKGSAVDVGNELKAMYDGEAAQWWEAMKDGADKKDVALELIAHWSLFLDDIKADVYAAAEQVPPPPKDKEDAVEEAPTGVIENAIAFGVDALSLEAPSFMINEASEMVDHSPELAKTLLNGIRHAMEKYEQVATLGFRLLQAQGGGAAASVGSTLAPRKDGPGSEIVYKKAYELVREMCGVCIAMVVMVGTNVCCYRYVAPVVKDLN